MIRFLRYCSGSKNPSQCLNFLWMCHFVNFSNRIQLCILQSLLQLPHAYKTFFGLQNMVWMLRSTSLRTNVTYYIFYYMTLNTLFATLLPIGALLFFSLSTIKGLNSIRKLFETSVPMRLSSARLQSTSKVNHEATSDTEAEKVSLHSARRSTTRLSISVSFKNKKSIQTNTIGKLTIHIRNTNENKGVIKHAN